MNAHTGDSQQAMERARRAIALIHEWPRIPWWRIVQRRRCAHGDRLCVHGDGINILGGARAVCMDCGRRFASLPFICRFTDSPHPSQLSGSSPAGEQDRG